MRPDPSLPARAPCSPAPSPLALALAAALVAGCGGGSAEGGGGSGGGVHCAGYPMSCDDVVERYLHDAAEAAPAAIDLETACDSGRGDACRALGFFLIDGEEVAHDRRRAIELLSHGCDSGHGRSCVRLGQIMLAGDPSAADATRGVEAYEHACQTGEVVGCEALGRLYETGRHVQQDADRAMTHYGLACEGYTAGPVQGMFAQAKQEAAAEACRRMGDHYIVAEDHTALRAHYNRTCELGLAVSCTRLASILEKGDHVAPDPGRALPLYRQACEAHEPEACTRLGVARIDGSLGTEVDRARATELLQGACEQEYWTACAHLGRMAQEDGNMGQALRMYERACNRRDGLGCFQLGVAYAEGTGVRRDMERAVSLLRSACEAGTSPEACGWLATAYRRGEGVEADLEEAAALYHRACDTGHVASCARLSIMLEQGLGVPVDRPRARAYREQACRQGPFPEVCEERQIGRRRWPGTVTEAEHAPVGVDASCAVVVSEVLEPNWCHVRVVCGATDLFGREGSYTRCTVTGTQIPRVVIEDGVAAGAVLDLDTRARRAELHGASDMRIQIALE